MLGTQDSPVETWKGWAGNQESVIPTQLMLLHMQLRETILSQTLTATITVLF